MDSTLMDSAAYPAVAVVDEALPDEAWPEGRWELAGPVRTLLREPVVPPGWRLLSAGTVRRVKVFAPHLKNAKRAAFYVIQPATEEDRVTRHFWAHEVRVLGESRLVAGEEPGCAGGRGAWVETTAALLVREV